VPEVAVPGDERHLVVETGLSDQGLGDPVYASVNGPTLPGPIAAIDFHADQIVTDLEIDDIDLDWVA
jgi:hypothetical protein